MRVLSLSHRLPHRLLDNHTIINAPNIADYEAIVIDLAATFDVVRAAARAEGQFQTHADVPVHDGDSVDGTAGLASLLQRRREEIVRALERGAVVCAFLAPQSRFHGVTGLTGFDRFFFLPAPDGMAWDEATIRGSEGTTAAVVEHGHPLVGVFDTYDRDVLYRAVFNQRAPGFSRHARTFIRAAGGDPVGVEFPVLNGRIVFLPAVKPGSADKVASPMAGAIVEALSALLGRGDAEAPRWISEFSPPGLSERNAAEREARQALEAARFAVEEAESAAASLRSLRDVLWATGDAMLLPGVVRCAEVLGFTSDESATGEATLADGPTTLQLVAAASNEAVDMAPHYRLRQRLDQIIEARAIAPRGLLVVNGQRDTHPNERKREYVDAVRVAAESVGYALVTSAQLYRAAVAALAGAADETKAEMRRRLATTNGVVTFDDLLGEG